MQELGWTLVSGVDAGARRGFDKSQTRVFSDSAEELARKLASMPTNIRGNRDFLSALREQ